MPLGGGDGLDVWQVSSRIRTFTESVESEVESRIREEMNDATTILILGFGYLDQNVQLLTPGEKRNAHRIISSAYGLYVSLQAMSADGAVMVAGLVGVLLSATLDPVAVDAWGCRVALLLGLTILPFALAARRTLVETLEMEEALPPRAIAAGTRRIVVLGLLMLAAATVSNYVLVYLGTWASTTLGIVQRSAFASVMLVGLGGVLCDPMSGWLSDRFGRRPVMIVPAAVLALLVPPAFWYVAHHPSPGALYVASTLLAGVLDLSTGTMLVAVAEGLPRARRADGFALIYAVAISAFGGSTQFAVPG